MALSPERRHQGTPTPHAHEREALDHVYSVVSDFDPHHAWELHELYDPASGRLYELDLVFLSRVGLILVEIKSHPGVLTGDSVDWTFTEESGRRRHLECPYRSVNHKARVFGGLLDRQRWPQRPWIHAAVFVSNATDIRLEGGRPPWLLTRDTVGPALMRGFSEQPPRVLVNKPMMKQVLHGMEKLGLRPSSSVRTVSGYVLGELVDDGEGYQEHLAQLRDVASDTARVRTYLVPGATTPERRAQLERAAKREAQTLSQLGKHPGILHYRTYVPDAAMGPAVLFESFEDSLPLDAFLRQHPELTFDERFEILQQIVEAVAHCHRASVLHRNLSPASVLVRRIGTNGPLEVRVHRFQTAAWMEHSSFGTLHLHDLAHERERIYQAPEVLADPSKASIESDVFSVGCLAWLLFTDQAPAATIVEREKRLQGVTDADSGLRPSSVRGDLAVLDEAIAFATAPWAQNRAYNVAEWFRDYFVEHLTRPDPDPETRIDPRKAQKGDQLPGGLKVVRRLGTGGTAVVLHVKRGERDLALKIPHDEGCARQIENEARVLRELRHQHIVEFIDLIEINGLPCLLMQYAGEHSLGDVLRKEGTLSLELARRYGEDLLSAVQYLEEKGLTHRDIKPGNVGFTSQAKKQQHLLLLDFSLSGADPKSVTAGTAEWRDPWLYLRQWDEAADRWSVAMVLHHALTGARPVQNPKDPSGALQVDAERFDAAVRDRLAAFFRRALAKEPADRFQTAEAMRHAWVEALSEERPNEDAQPSSIALSDVRPETPVDALPLSTRARNALDRAGVPTVRELLALPRNQLSVIRGVGVQVAREIIDLADALRRMMELTSGPALLPGFLRPRLSVEDPDLGLAPEASEALLEAGLAHTVDLAQAQRSRVERLIGPDAAAALTSKLELLAALEPAPGSLGEWARTLLGRASETEANRRLRILTGLDPLPEGHADVGPAAMRSVPQVAEALQIDTTHLHSSLQFMRTRRWAEHETAQALRGTLSELLDGLGPVVSFEELADALAEFRSGTQASAEDRRLAAALVRVGLEVRPEPVARWRRWGETAWIARDALSLEALGALAAEADRLAQQEPLPSSETVRSALAEAVKGTLLAELPPDLRLTLASRASRHAAASARLELYPRGMDAKRALRLSLGTLTGPGLTVERVRGRVRARYPSAEELPERPALDALLEPHGLRFDPQAGDGVGEYVRPGQSTTTSMTVAPIQRLTTAPPIAQTPRASPEAQVAAAFDELLQGGVSAQRFRVVQVRADLASAATVELERSLGVQAVSFDHAFVEALRAEASALEVDWANVEAADRAGPEGPDWSLLLQLVQPATQKLVTRLLGEPETPLLLAWPGTLARYGLSQALQTLVMHSQLGEGGAVVLIVPSHADGLAPMINGTLPVPVPLPSQRLVMPESWLANAHGAESA